MGNSGTKARGRCPACGREFALTVLGRLRRHGTRDKRRDNAMIVCDGTGQAPA